MLLSAYLLLLMVMPCSEAHASHSHKTVTKVMKLSDEHHHSDIEICTPFCVCSSCVVAVVVQPVTEFWFFVPDIPTTGISNFYRSVKSDFHGSIWQPPQLV